MSHLKAAYKILSHLRDSERFDEFDFESFNEKAFGLSHRMWLLTPERLLDSGLIKGVSAQIGPVNVLVATVQYPRITTKGLEYLEGPAMTEQSNGAKGIG